MLDFFKKHKKNTSATIEPMGTEDNKSNAYVPSSYEDLETKIKTLSQTMNDDSAKEIMSLLDKYDAVHAVGYNIVGERGETSTHFGKESALSSDDMLSAYCKALVTVNPDLPPDIIEQNFNVHSGVTNQMTMNDKGDIQAIRDESLIKNIDPKNLVGIALKEAATEAKNAKVDGKAGEVEGPDGPDGPQGRVIKKLEEAIDAKKLELKAEATTPKLSG